MLGNLLQKIGADINNLIPEGKSKEYRDGVNAVWTIVFNRFMEESEDQSDEAKHKSKTGYWIKGTNDYHASYYKCSECGCWHPAHNHGLRFYYCNRCGAKME